METWLSLMVISGTGFFLKCHCLCGFVFFQNQVPILHAPTTGLLMSVGIRFQGLTFKVYSGA